ncbi:alanine racemase [Oculatella sp. LEGE 06141]|uniref:alanine racemase n=1 Tax=Oculatella sp. LEGE 06141 TaxID=1828648 RepID=UPI00187FA51C|nr:alanine racemase [Oculatella sp. LEGE 06141]MBE9183017.1 alanine racemase [Oculatella sp. LEGE 06141]
MNQAFWQSIQHESSWCELSASAIRSNISALRHRVGEDVTLGVVVKSDAFGHGLTSCARAFVESGADWLIVNFAYEAVKLRQAGITAPIYICGNTSVAQAAMVVAAQARVVLYDADVAQALAKAGREAGYTVPVHLKVETGTHRQGLELDEAIALARLVSELDGITLEGIATHYADIEDTTDHRFAHQQLSLLKEAQNAFTQAGFDLPMIHSANSAATILWTETHGSLVRVGLAAYGLWPSKEVYAKVLQTFTAKGEGFIPNLQPVLSWRSRVVQVKEVPVGGYVSYGRTFRATYPMRVAVLPLGYYEGYDRRLSNLGYVLINGVRSPIRGRVCMNMTMVDVTHIPNVQAGSVATLLGADGDECISAEQLAAWMGTINYEVVSRIHPSQSRYLIDDDSAINDAKADQSLTQISSN